MADEPDWRLSNQENYLKGVTLVHRRYRRYPLDPTWDHDHCAFCWAKFMVEDHADVLHHGYATSDDYHWVCDKCFDDFKDLFGWSVIDELS
ncbi:MAG: hypothetical protein ABSG68_23230 [Thermoguttaceae bacterium]|jgi:hypothetical protein